MPDFGLAGEFRVDLSKSAGVFQKACITLVYTGAMPTTKQVRRSVSLPAQVAKQVDSLARRRRLSENRVLVGLIEEGIEAQKKKEQEFFELAGRFRAAKDPDEVQRLGDGLARFVFGESRESINTKIRRGIEQLNRGEGVPDARLDAYLTKLKRQA
jgi:predicted transcriptional regulator